MPYDCPNDPDMPEYVQDLEESQRDRWCNIWNSSFESCREDGGDVQDCERVAFRNANGVVLQVKTVAVNVDGQVRREVRDGREWIVAPVVAIREGVLNGELAPAEEFSKYVELWNGRPFVLGHPVNADGFHITANNPATLERLGLGNMYNAEWVPEINGIRAEIWADVDKMQSLGGDALEVMARLEDAEPLEVSTAYFRDFDEAPGQFGDQMYSGVQRNIRPDHIAALPNDIGACSWLDGCGAPRVHKLMVNVLGEARAPEYDGTTSGDWSAPSWEDYVSAYYERNPDAEGEPEDAETVDAAPGPLKQWAASRSLLGDPDAEDFANLVFFPVVDPSSDELNEQALRAVIGGRGAQADIPGDALESARRQAYSLLNDEFDAGLEYEPIEDQGEEDVEENEVNGTEELEEELQDNQEETEETSAEELAANLRVDVLADERLTVNEEVLDTFDADQLEAVLWTLGQVPACPSVNTEVDEGERAMTEEFVNTVNELGGIDNIKRLLGGLAANEEKARRRLIAGLAANERCPFEEDELESFTNDQLERLAASYQPSDYSGVGLSMVTQSNEDDDVEVLPMPKRDAN